ncbi:MAG: DUF4330 family protein [Bacillota bacterium]
MIDKRGRLFGKVNVLDLLIILALLLAGGKLAWDRLNVQEIVAPPQDDVIMELRAYVLTPIADNVQLGQKVTDKRTGIYLGEIAQLQISDMEPGSVGTLGAPYQEIRMLVTNKAHVTDQVYRLGGLEVRIGDSITVLGPKYSLSSTVIDLNKRD